MQITKGGQKLEISRRQILWLGKKSFESLSLKNKNLPQIRRNAKIILTSCCCRMKNRNLNQNNFCSVFGKKNWQCWIFLSIHLFVTKDQKFCHIFLATFFPIQNVSLLRKRLGENRRTKILRAFKRTHAHFTHTLSLSSHISSSHTHTHWHALFPYTLSLSLSHTRTCKELLRTTNPPQATLYSSETPWQEKQTS